MFIFSLNRLVVVREFGYLQPGKRNIHTAIFDTKQNNVEAKGNVAFFFFGLNKTLVCMIGTCAKFPFKQKFVYLYLHFHRSSINFKLKGVLFYVNKR